MEAESLFKKVRVYLNECLVYTTDKILAITETKRNHITKIKINDTEIYSGDTRNLTTLNLTINGDVNGEIDVLGNINIKGNSKGGIDAGGSINIGGSSSGGIDAGGSVNIKGNSEGDLDAGGSIKIEGSSDGNLDAGGSITVKNNTGCIHMQ